MMSVIGSKIHLICYSNLKLDNISTISSAINIRLFFVFQSVWRFIRSPFKIS